MVHAKLGHDAFAEPHLDRRDYVELDLAPLCVCRTLVGPALLPDIVEGKPISPIE
jgi:hypothetical protein